MYSIPQISHTEYEPDAGIGTGLIVPDVFMSRMFRGVPAIDRLSMDQRIPTARLILVSQEAAANQRRGFYYKYIGALAGVGLNAALTHHLDSNSHAYSPENIPSEALTIFARAVFLAGDKLNVHALYDETQGASAEHGHVTQFGDWNMDSDLKAAIESLPSDDRIVSLGVSFEKIHNVLDLSDVRYKAKIDDNPNTESEYPAITVSRVRPVADLALQSLTGATHRIEMVKRSTFAVVGDQADREAKKRIAAFLGERNHKGAKATTLGQSVVERAIAEYRSGNISFDTFPAESVYFAILRKRPNM